MDDSISLESVCGAKFDGSARAFTKALHESQFHFYLLSFFLLLSPRSLSLSLIKVRIMDTSETEHTCFQCFVLGANELKRLKQTEIQLRFRPSKNIKHQFRE